jgi:Domain of unknown function (DUF1905)
MRSVIAVRLTMYRPIPEATMSKLDKTFTATLLKSPNKLPIRTDVRKSIGKEAGDTVSVRLDERIGK